MGFQGKFDEEAGTIEVSGAGMDLELLDRAIRWMQRVQQFLGFQLFGRGHDGIDVVRQPEFLVAADRETAAAELVRDLVPESLLGRIHEATRFMASMRAMRKSWASPGVSNLQMSARLEFHRMVTVLGCSVTRVTLAMCRTAYA